MTRKWVNLAELSAARKPDERDDHDHRISRKDRNPPRVGRAYAHPSERERADDREQEDDPDRQDDREDVERP